MAMEAKTVKELSEKLASEYDTADACDRFCDFFFGRHLHFDYYRG